MLTRMTETLADRIRQRLEQTGLSANAASRKAGGSPSLIPNILLGRSQSPRIETVKKIADVLGTSVDWLMNGTSNAQPTGEALSAPLEPSNVDLLELKPPSLIDLPMTLPILGTALGSIVAENVQGFQFEPGEVLGYVRRPQSLAKVREAYAVLVRGDSMDPMHPPNQVRVVNPLRACEPGDSVVVITRHWDDDPGQAYIKILRRRTEAAIVLEQINPRVRLEIPRKYVAGIHYVLTMNDLLGY